MRLKTLHETEWTLYAVCTDRGDCPLEAFFADLGANHQRARTKMIALLDHVAERGTLNLPDTKCHQVGKHIFEFIAGRLRVFWFYDEGKLIICTHGLFKQTQKTPREEIEQAEHIRATYLDDKVKGDLILEATA